MPPLAAACVGSPSSSDLSRLPAVALFAQRARAVAPAFALTPANAATVAAICRRLDGLPLAIELAAAWVKVLPVASLLARLERALPLLADGPRDLPARQRTLRDTIGWSYALLTTPQQTLLRRLSIFSGGCTLELAEAVCASADEAPGAVLALIAALVDASLLQPPAGASAALDAAPPRYTMLETIREYAGELLAANGEAEDLQRRHADVLLALAEEAQSRLIGPDEVIWLDRLNAEHPNLRVALRWALDRRQADRAVRFASALWRFWAERTHLTEGRRSLARRDPRPRPRDARPRRCHARRGRRRAPQLAMLLHVSANLARAQGDYAPAEAMYRECLALRRAHGDRIGMMGALHNLGIIAHERGDHVGAIGFYEEALALGRTVDHPYGLAFVLVSLGARDPRRRRTIARGGVLRRGPRALPADRPQLGRRGCAPRPGRDVARPG